ncbi:unnamed protein product [Bemisia tabaci]|uniref:HAT C-terminal dimerisation domain-containing protein n=1 Tax=Bemisia tabaci TaxID=7038 RepID=A0A9P0F490_BEMTA|nr:unnamed protein product [Bemisia tabaci]
MSRSVNFSCQVLVECLKPESYCQSSFVLCLTYVPQYGETQEDLQSCGASLSQQRTQKNSIEEELDQYLARPLTPKDVSPYDYWAKEGKHSFKLLYNCARKYFPIPASEVNREHQFSTAGLILTDLEASLYPQNLGILTFLHENMTCYI